MDVSRVMLTGKVAIVTCGARGLGRGMLAAGRWLRHPTLGWTTDVRAFESEGQ